MSVFRLAVTIVRMEVVLTRQCERDQKGMLTYFSDNVVCEVELRIC